MEKYLASFNLLSAAEINYLAGRGQTKTLKKGAYFIKEGSVCQEVAFVQSGFFRSFYHNSEGEEITYCFTFADSFVTAYSSFISQTKTFENIEALTTTTIFTIPRADIIQLEQTSINWARLFKMMAEQEYMKLEQRFILFLKESAEYRYKDLLHKYPEYLQLIPLGYLSSYLGITQRHLSRIRKSVMN
ncbi:Crp/Fnr family transcriptional regulator [Chitinophaga sp. LS1]|uniref:Crp/Fnr family transcriptional regulator n=1 Tax=Chitinophaga sp. LS1 TaxID=3051176 RepID=UPI002AAC26DE|nr:Crp/Fnr family transcriptional regulator [Chitinophaga sp. LS1]WPV64022.1 Crp/Fnr family transcriptional regulator [Chitinophaga sp. LS1]